MELYRRQALNMNKDERGTLMATIKKGSTFIATIMFTENEWAGVYPWDEIIAFITQESKRSELEVVVDVENYTATITGDTAEWQVGPAKFDIWIMNGESTIPVPNGYSIEIMVIQGGLMA